MRKTVTKTYIVEVIRECAYCDRECDYEGKAISKWGQIDIWVCPVHGRFEEVDSPLLNRGSQIR